MAQAKVVTVNGSRYRGFQTHHAATFGDGRIAKYVQIECDNGVVVTVYPDGTVGRKDWDEEHGGMPRIAGRH